ncbi:MAG: PAS domain S-box protein [Desulfobacterales bacterium]|nr:PAS domain S-box protein [Desulfobacterales bacterium]
MTKRPDPEAGKKNHDDIRKEPEHNLKNYRLLFEYGTDAVFILDPESLKILDANPAASELYGFTAKEFTGMHILELSAEPETSTLAIDRFKHGGKLRVPLRIHRRKNGSPIKVALNIFTAGKDQSTAFLTVREITEKTKIQESLRASETINKTVLSSISDAVFITDDNGRFTFICPNVHVIFGYCHEEVAEMGNITGLLGLQMVDVHAFQQIDELRNQELLIRDKSGKPHNLLVNIKKVQIQDGTLMYTCRDVTERHQAEKALKESEQKFKRMFEQAPLSYQSLDDRGNFTAVNDTWLKTLGYRSEEVIGRNFSEFLQPGWQDHFEQNFPRFKAVGEVLGVEFEMIKKDGSAMLVSFHGRIGKDKMGNFERTHCVFHDITLQRAAEKTMNNELRLHQAVAGISRELLAEEYDIRNVSDITLEYAQNLTGSAFGFVSAIDRFTRDNIGHTIADMFGDACHIENRDIAFPIGDDGTYPGLWGHALNTGEAFFTNTPSNHPSSTGLPSGHIPLTNFLAVPVSIGGRLLGLIALANADRDYAEKDITGIRRIAEVFAIALHRAEYETERRKMEQNLRQLQKIEAIGALAGGIAHDFNNILFPIVGFAEMLDEDLAPDSPLKENAEEILSGAKRAKELVKQILTFSRQTDHEVVPLHPHLIVKEVAKLVKSIIPTYIRIRHKIDKDTRPILADPTQIHQVAMNLTTNAYHAMEENGGTLTIKLENKDISDADPEFPTLEAGPYIQFTVADTGTGMPGHIQEKIFDPYFTTKPKGKGTGLGLSVVHGIIKNYGGDIFVESTPGEGTSFTICLPALDNASTPVESKEIMEDQAGQGHIMLVDDEPVILRIEEQILQRLGYTTRSFLDSEAALDAVRSDPGAYDLVVTDMTMPNLTGDRLTIAIKKIAPDLPVLICTGYSERISPDEAEAIGAGGLLYKPVVKTDMARMLNRLLG